MCGLQFILISSPFKVCKNCIINKVKKKTNYSNILNIFVFQIDAGTSTDASTLTEPENLGPCEPGTAVNLEGIVWHETDTGTTTIIYRDQPTGFPKGCLQKNDEISWKF